MFFAMSMPQSENADAQDRGHSDPRPVRFGIRLDNTLSRILGGEVVVLLLIAVLIGVAAGYGAILFRYLIEWVNRIAFPGGILLDELSATSWYRMLLAPAVGGLVVGPLVYFFAREAKGHGVPEVMEACAERGGRIRPRVAIVKILASAVCIGSGGSVGREGPIIQIGSAVGSTLGQILGMHGERLKTLVATGAAAGIAATFNAPIAGVLFAIELIVGKASPTTFSPIVVGAVIATAISRHHLGNFPAFQVAPYDLVSAYEIPLYAILGGLAAIAGLAFTRGLYALEDLWDLLPVPTWPKAAVGGAVVGAVALWMPQVMGVGYEYIEQVLNWESGQIAVGTMTGIGLLMLLASLKIFTTGTTIGSGGSGGIFAPSLFIGASLGCAFGLLVNALMPAGTVAGPSAYSLVAMGALVAATTHAPLTAIIIVFELTDQHTIILPLMLSCILSYLIATRLSPESIYTLKLVRRGTRLAVGAEAEMMAATPVHTLAQPVDPTLRMDTRLPAIIERAISGGRSPQYITDAEGRLLGLIFREDVIAVIRDEDFLRHVVVASDLVRPPAATVHPDDNLDRCMSLFGQLHLEELPVVERDQRLVGRISQSDAINLYNRKVLHRVAVLRFVGEDATEPSREELVHVPSGEVKDEIPVGGGLVGQSLRTLDLRARLGVSVYSVRHRHGGSSFPDPEAPLVKGDTLLVVGPRDRVTGLRKLARSRPADAKTTHDQA